MERCGTCKSSPCKCSSKCSHMLAPLAVLAIAVVILLGNLGIITAHLTSILWPILLGIAAILKMVACGHDAAKEHKHCPPCRCDKCTYEKSLNPPPSI